jgi:hypothetical protein
MDVTNLPPGDTGNPAPSVTAGTEALEAKVGELSAALKAQSELLAKLAVTAPAPATKAEPKPNEPVDLQSLVQQQVSALLDQRNAQVTAERNLGDVSEFLKSEYQDVEKGFGELAAANGMTVDQLKEMAKQMPQVVKKLAPPKPANKEIAGSLTSVGGGAAVVSTSGVKQGETAKPSLRSGLFAVNSQDRVAAFKTGFAQFADNFKKSNQGV